MKKYLISFCLMGVFFSNQSFAQLFTSPSVVKSGIEDANKIFGAYLSPLLIGWSSGLNNNWYTTAQPHGLGGFDITVSAGGFFVPQQATTYNALDLHLQNAQPSPGSDVTKAATLFGNTAVGPKMDVIYRVPGYANFPVGSFNLPSGTGYYFFPSIPNIQLAIGLIKKTEVMLRYVPDINLRDFKSHVYGIGIKHDLKQWIPGINKASFDLSGVGAYSITGAEYLIPESSRLYPDDYSYPGAQPKAYYDNQRFAMNTKAWMLGFVLSKQLKFITPYAGISYNYSYIRFRVLGNYPVPVFEPTTSLFTPTIKNVSDQITLENTDNSWRANLGIRLKVSYVTLHAEYTLARYQTVTAGIGFNVQSMRPFKR